MADKNGLMRRPIPGRSLPTNPFYADLSLSAQTAYAQLIDHAMTATMNRTIADLSGAFVKKVVAGKEYWCFQYCELRELDERARLNKSISVPAASASIE
jgi:hypothetical protein